jgi:hypothetical protein
VGAVVEVGQGFLPGRLAGFSCVRSR